MKRIFKILLVLLAVAFSAFLTESVVLAEGSGSAVYTVSKIDSGYALISGGVSIAEGDDLSELVDAIPDSGAYEVHFDTVSTERDLTLYGGDVTVSGVLSFLGDASLTVDGARLGISGAAVAFESGHLRIKRGELAMSGGSLSSVDIAVLSDFSASSVIRITGGSISSESSSAIVIERGSVSISGGDIRGAESALLAYTGVTLSGSPTLSGREYDIVSDTELTLFSEYGVYRGAARVKLLSDFPEGVASVAVYAKAPESLIGITLFDINGICHPIYFLDKNESGVGEPVGAVLRPYKVTFYNGEDILLKSDYIKGRELEIPDAPSLLGYTFSGWRTDDGEPYDFNTDLGSDISLFASYTLTAPTYTLLSPSFVYDGGTRFIELRDLYHPLLSEGFLSYEWFKGGVALNSFGETHPVRTVGDSGEYTVRITFTVGKSSVSFTSPVADVIITKKTVELPKIPSVKYTGSEIAPDISETPEYTVASVLGTPVGVYPVAITLKDSENYCFRDCADTTVYVDFVIEKGINEWSTPLSVSDIYEGGVLTPAASARFGTVEILYRRVGDTQLSPDLPTSAGEYVARAFVVGTENYTPLEGVEVTFKIIAERVVGISVTKRPEKDTYRAFETLSYEGIEVLAMYNSTRLESVAPENLIFIYQTADSFRYGDSGVTVSYGGVNVTLPLTVEKAEYDLSLIDFSNVSVTYRGTLVTLPVPENLPIGLDGIPLVGTVCGGGTAVGEYPVSLEFSSESRNYKLPASVSATLTITPYVCEAVWSDTSFTYDGGEKLPTAFYLDVFGRRVTVSVKGARSLAGEYIATLTVTDTNYVISNPTSTFVINKADYDISGITWCGGGEVYDGKEKNVYITSLPEGVGVIGYVNNRATESGTYTARASLSYDTENYNPPAVPEFSWQILCRDYETDGFHFSDAEYIFDKNPHYPTLVGEMPVGIDGVALEYEFSHGVINVREGRAAVRVIFKTKSTNYNPPKSQVAYVTVLPKEISVVWSGLSATYSGAYILPTATSPECNVTVVGGGSVAGEYELTATADDPNYKVVNSKAVLVILKAENKWIVTPTVSDIFYGREPMPRAEARAGAVQYTYYSVTDPKTPLFDLPRAVGEYSVVAYSDGDNNYLPISYEPLFFKIIAVVPISLDVSLGKDEFSAFEMLDGGNTEVYLSYNDGTRQAIDLDEVDIAYPRAEHFLFGDSEVKVSYGGYTVAMTVTVCRADYDLSAVRWENTLTVYDGSYKCAYLSGLPDGVSILEYVGGGIGAGEYTVRAILSYDTENYNAPVLPDATLTVAKMCIPTPIVAPHEYNGVSVLPSGLDTALYTASVTEGKYPGAYPIVFTVRDAENYEFATGESVKVDFVIEKRKLTLQINTVEVGLFERAPDFSFEICDGSLLSGDELSLVFTVKDGKIYADTDMPNYDITVIEGEYIRTYKMSVLSALLLFIFFLILIIITVIIILFVRRWRNALSTQTVLVAVGASIDNATQENSANNKENTEQKQDKNDIVITDPISVDYANEAISNSLAKDLIRREVTVSTDGWRRGIINVDTLSESFSAGERVDVNILKRKSLVPYDTAYIKVLARGVIDKPLHVYANDFSLSAVKMIALAGGKSIKVTSDIRKKENLA